MNAQVATPEYYRNTTVFLSDLHLSAERPAIAALFLDFLTRVAVQCDALYILGDLFEAWLGDDDLDPDNERVLAALRGLADSGVPLYFVHGNRDFLAGPEFEARSGCHLLPDPSLINLYGHPALLLHGDSLCTQDMHYQRARAQVRGKAWQRWFLAQPLAERAERALIYRAQSETRKDNKAEYIMDVDQDTVTAVLREHTVGLMIHGHTHRPAVHEIMVDGRAAQRIVLGDWYKQGSVLRCTAAGCALETLPLPCAAPVNSP